MSDIAAFVNMYTGAAEALGMLPGGSTLAEMARLTPDPQTAREAIRRMRSGAPGDKLYPALKWLREEAQKHTGGKQVDLPALRTARETVKKHGEIFEAWLEPKYYRAMLGAFDAIIDEGFRG